MIEVKNLPRYSYRRLGPSSIYSQIRIKTPSTADFPYPGKSGLLILANLMESAIITSGAMLMLKIALVALLGIVIQ